MSDLNLTEAELKMRRQVRRLYLEDQGARNLFDNLCKSQKPTSGMYVQRLAALIKMPTSIACELAKKLERTGCVSLRKKENGKLYLSWKGNYIELARMVTTNVLDDVEPSNPVDPIPGNETARERLRRLLTDALLALDEMDDLTLIGSDKPMEDDLKPPQLARRPLDQRDNGDAEEFGGLFDHSPEAGAEQPNTAFSERSNGQRLDYPKTV